MGSGGLELLSCRCGFILVKGTLSGNFMMLYVGERDNGLG